MSDGPVIPLMKKRRAYSHTCFKKGGKVEGHKGRHRAFGGKAETTDKEVKEAGHSQESQETAWDKYKSGGGIHIKPSHKGLLHKDLGVKSGNKIPEKKLEKAEKSSNPAVRKRAVFAENAKHWHHK